MKAILFYLIILLSILSCQPGGRTETPQDGQPEITGISRYFLAEGNVLEVVSNQEGWVYLVPQQTESNLTDIENQVNSNPALGIKLSAHAGTPVLFSLETLGYGSYVIYALGDNERLSSASAVISYREEISFDVAFFNGSEVPFGGSQGNKCYAFWLEGSTIQNLFVCQNVRNLSHSLLPYWETNIEPNSIPTELDSVTGATHRDSTDSKNCDFVLSDQILQDSHNQRFMLYMEIARSWDRNDWFSGSSEQPALLYGVEIDLASPQSRYELLPIGWTPNSGNPVPQGIDIQSWAINTLNQEMKYITQQRNSQGDFGPADGENSATLMVESVMVEMK